MNNRSGAFITTHSEKFALHRGAACLIPAWLSFQTGISARSVAIRQDYLHFEYLGFPPTLQRHLFRAPIRLPAGGGLDDLIVRWREGFTTGSWPVGSWAWAQTVAQAAMASALDALPPSGREECQKWLEHSGRLEPALSQINQRLNHPPSNAELATLCHLGEDHFIRTFRRAIGITPAQYGLERRVTAAATWLVRTQRTIDDIALATGFTDRFHFSRCFKSRLAVSPAVYRNLHRSRTE